MGRAARLPYSLKVEVVKLPLTPRALVLEGPHLAILISATRMELQEGRSIGLEFPELPVRALIDTGASLTIIKVIINLTNHGYRSTLQLWNSQRHSNRPSSTTAMSKSALTLWLGCAGPMALSALLAP